MAVYCKRLTIGAVDGVAGFRRLVADSPSRGREFSDSIDRYRTDKKFWKWRLKNTAFKINSAAMRCTLVVGWNPSQKT
jgi:hypothetical protein